VNRNLLLVALFCVFGGGIAAAVVGCGGPEKPPLTPDGPDMTMPDAALD
jgi:hypothetical protein